MIKYLLEKGIQATAAQPDASADTARISLHHPAGVALGPQTLKIKNMNLA